MSERFEKLYQLPTNLYSENAPVIVVAGALLKDSVSGSVIVQIKFKSVSGMPIKALKVDVKALDVSGQQLQGVDDYQYLDLNVHNGMEFGSNKAIVMPVAVTRSFQISRITVVFEDSSTWVSSAEMLALPEAKSLQSIMENHELLKQYRLATSAEAKDIPIESMNLWKCTCGEWNSTSKCYRCRCDRSIVFSALTMEELNEKMEERLVAEKEQREEQARLLEIARQEQAERDRIAAEKEAERRNAQKKKLTIATMIAAPVLVIVLVFSLWVYPTFIEPIVVENQFDKAVSILKESSNHSEEEVLEALSLVMMTGLDNRLEYADDSSKTEDEEYYRNVLSAEDHLLDIGSLDITNELVKSAFSTYVDGLKLQNQTLDSYASNSNSNYADLTMEQDWIDGARLRSSAIVTLYKEGLLSLSAEDYGVYCALYIETQLEDELVGTITLSVYDDNHYCITARLKNDTLADFEGFEVWSLWNDEEVYASIDKWESGESWNAEFIVSDSALEGDNIVLDFSAYYDGITVRSPNG